MTYCYGSRCYVCLKLLAETANRQFCEDPLRCAEVFHQTAQIRKAGFEMVMEARRVLAEQCSRHLDFAVSPQVLANVYPLDGEGYAYLNSEEEYQLREIHEKLLPHGGQDH